MKLDSDKIDWSEIPEIYTKEELYRRQSKISYLYDDNLNGYISAFRELIKHGRLPFPRYRN